MSEEGELLLGQVRFASLGSHAPRQPVHSLSHGAGHFEEVGVWRHAPIIS
jgi:hypothetical protein